MIGSRPQGVDSTAPAKAHRGDPGWPELLAHGTEVALDFSPPLRLVGQLVGRREAPIRASCWQRKTWPLSTYRLHLGAKEHVGLPGLVTKLGLKLLVSGRGEQLSCAQAARFEEAIQR